MRESELIPYSLLVVGRRHTIGVWHDCRQFLRVPAFWSRATLPQAGLQERLIKTKLIALVLIKPWFDNILGIMPGVEVVNVENVLGAPR